MKFIKSEIIIIMSEKVNVISNYILFEVKFMFRFYLLHCR